VTEQPKAFPDVQGRCPACGWTTLFLGAGGHVTCARLDCPNPCAADDQLHQTRPAEAALARIATLADQHPAGIDTALIHEALDTGRQHASDTLTRIRDYLDSTEGPCCETVRRALRGIIDGPAATQATDTPSWLHQGTRDLSIPAQQPAGHCGHLAPTTLLTTRPTECVLRPGHTGSHSDDRGCRWWYDPTADQRRTTANNPATSKEHTT
jgi:hypothetical protein